MYLHLYHGRKNPNQEMEDWGDELQISFKINTLVCTYETHIRVQGENDAEPFDLCFGESCLYYDGVYYGDWSINEEPFYEDNIQELDENKAKRPTSSKYFEVNGYWKDDGEEFEGYIIKEFDDYDEDTDNGEDDLIFFYGLTEDEIIEAIRKQDKTELEFVVTDYKVIKL